MAHAELSPEARAQSLGVSALLALAALGLGLWAKRPRPPAVDPVVVEVAGQVPAPGFYALTPPATVGEALAAAGAEPVEGADSPVSMGDRLSLGPSGLERDRTEAAMVLGVPLDLNRASAAALETLPGVGARRAADIVADREARGPFGTIDELDRVRGVGPATVERLRPYLSVAPPTR